MGQLTVRRLALVLAAIDCGAGPPEAQQTRGGRPYPSGNPKDASFDCVLSTFGVMFSPGLRIRISWLPSIAP
jgi:hypothetical protein